jgi:hypothetical protein
VNLPFDEADFVRRVDVILDGVAQSIRKDFEETVKTFRDKPDFYIFVRDEDRVVVGTLDEVYGYLNDGTRIRYAIMSADFKAKTKSGRLKAAPGQGGLMRIDTKHPRPGIKARKFDARIAKKWEKKIVNIFKNKKF